MDDDWAPQLSLDDASQRDVGWLIREMHTAIVSGILERELPEALAAVAFTPSSDPGLLRPAFIHLCSRGERDRVDFNDLAAALEFWTHVDGWSTGSFDIDPLTATERFERRESNAWVALETAGSLDPGRYVLIELARELTNRWAPSVERTDDFVAYPAGYEDVTMENLRLTASADVVRLLRTRHYLPEDEQ